MRVLPKTILSFVPVFVLVFVAWLFASPAMAQGTRILPVNVVVGELQGVNYPYVKISDKVWRLAPGSRIRDRDNRIVLPASAPQSGRVVFNFDSLGQVLGLWVLTAQELPLHPLPEK